MENKQYVVLEHLLMPDRGFRFFSTNKEDNTLLCDGTIAYSVIGFADTIEKAQDMLGPNLKTIPTIQEMEDHYKEQHDKTTKA